MIRWTGRTVILMEKPSISCDRQVVDAGVANPHQAVQVELPVFVPIGTKPVSRFILVFIGKTYRDAVIGEGPQLLNQTIIQFMLPFSC